MTKTIKVEGMMCAHCEARVNKALEKLDFISQSAADHEKNQVVLTVEGNYSEEAVKQVIEENDYRYLGEA